MNKENAIKFASLMEDYLNIPAFLCERIEKKLKENKYEEVIEFIIYRRKELEKWLKANDEHYAEAIPFRETLRKLNELKESDK